MSNLKSISIVVCLFIVVTICYYFLNQYLNYTAKQDTIAELKANELYKSECMKPIKPKEVAIDKNGIKYKEVIYCEFKDFIFVDGKWKEVIE